MTISSRADFNENDDSLASYIRERRASRLSARLSFLVIWAAYGSPDDDAPSTDVDALAGPLARFLRASGT
jgi:hypothetical protein